MSQLNPSGRLAFDRRAIPEQALENRWLTDDGQALRRIDWPPPETGRRGSILFMPGRGDAYEKYLDTLDHWHGRGWAVTAADWRGQAGSGRLGTDAVTGHISDFARWIDDLAAFWRDWKRGTPAPHVLAGHSMGGHLVLRAIAEQRVDPDAAVLSAPMLGLLPGWVPGGLLLGAARFMTAIGDPRRPAWKWNEKPGVPPADRIDLLTHDPDRYADELAWRTIRPELAMGPPSWGWMERAIASMNGLERAGVLESVECPVLVLATTADRLVDYGAICRAVSRLPHGRLETFGNEARHEILRESDGVRDRALAVVDSFLDETVPGGDGTG